MIAKRIHREKQTSDFARLGRYIVDAKGGHDPSSWTRTADYILDTKQEGAKVSGVRVTNCRTDDAAAATLEIMAVQARNTRSKTDKTYHLVISFPEGECPTADQLRNIEDACCLAIGLGDHQRISAVHVDTDNLHIHVAINKVHPRTFRNVEPYYDKLRLMEICEKLELEHGLIRTNHGLGNNLNAGRADDMEAHSGEDCLLRWIRENAAVKLADAIQQTATWENFHTALAKHDLEIRKRGAGFVIGTRDGRTFVKASSVSRDLSFKPLTAKLGDYLPPSEEVRMLKPDHAYTKDSGKTEREPSALYKLYLEKRDLAAEARERLFLEQKEQRANYSSQFAVWVEQKHRAIKASHLPRTDKAVAYKELRNERILDQHRRKDILKAHQETLAVERPYLTWPTFLQQEAESGNQEALRALRAMHRKQAQAKADILAAENMDEAIDIVFEHLKPKANRKGEMIYIAPDGGKVVDARDGVHVTEITPGATIIAFTLAAERFSGQTLVAKGSEDFRAGMIRAGILRGFDITTCNGSPELNGDRSEVHLSPLRL